MLEGKPAVFISCSEGFKRQVAVPFRAFIESLGMRGVIVSDEPRPEGVTDWDPDHKVAYFLDRCDLLVALATPDDRLEGGAVQTRQNIIDEIRAARERSHLANRMQVFKAPEVALASNINPTYDPLDVDDLAPSFELFERQARAFGVLPTGGPLPERAAPVATAPPEASVEIPDAPGSARVQAVTALNAVGEALTDSEATVGGKNIARAFLALSTELARSRSADLLGVHELNGLYRDRKELKLRSSERLHLFRTILANLPSENAPGWYWFRDLTTQELEDVLFRVVRTDSDTAVRVQGLRLISRSASPEDRRGLFRVLKAALASDSATQGAALAALAAHGDSHMLGALKGALDSCDHQDVPRARFGIRLRTSPVAAMRSVLTGDVSPTDEDLSKLIPISPRLPVSELRRALRGPTPAVRLLGLRALSAVSRLRKSETLELALNDQDDEVRLAALDLALKRRWHIPESDFESALEGITWHLDEREALWERYFTPRDPEELVEEPTWYGAIRSIYIYRSMAKNHFEAVKDRIREDLDSDFSELKARSRDRMEELIRAELEEKLREAGGDAAVEKNRRAIEERVHQGLTRILEQRDESTERFVLEKYQEAAMLGLAKHAEPSDVRFARRFLSSDNRELARLSVQIIRRAGTAEDLPRLKAYLDSATGTSAAEAAEAIIELADDVVVEARRLLESGKSYSRKIALRALTGESMGAELGSILLEYLWSDDDTTRADVADFFIAVLTRSALSRIIDVYANGKYFYNVITRLDRHLYAPPAMRSALPV